MKSWKIIIIHNEQVKEIIIEAQYYSDAYVNAELKYPGCIIKSISEIRK